MYFIMKIKRLIGENINFTPGLYTTNVTRERQRLRTTKCALLCGGGSDGCCLHVSFTALVTLL